MHFVVFFSVIAVYGRLEAATTTKIKYLPNGQIGGYELIINNTAPTPNLRTAHRPVPFKQANKILKTDDTFTRVDERIEGDNVFVNIQSLITKPKEKPKYPVSAILTVPSIRQNANGEIENVKLTFAKIGPYAALIVPNRSPGELNDNWIPSEIRDSIKAFIEVSDRPAPQRKSGYSYPPKISAAGDANVEPRASHDEVSGGFPKRGSSFGAYEPAKYEYYNCDVSTKGKCTRNKIQEPSNPPEIAASSKIKTVQKSNGLLITLTNQNLTLFAPNPNGKQNTYTSERGPNLLYPYPAASSSKSYEAESNVARKNEDTIKSPYHYSFSLSEQPSIVKPARENPGLGIGTSVGSSEFNRNQATDEKSVGNDFSGRSRAVDSQYGLPFPRNSVSGDTEQPIASQTVSYINRAKISYNVSSTNGSSPYRNIPTNRLQLTNIPTGVSDYNYPQQHAMPLYRYARSFGWSEKFTPPQNSTNSRQSITGSKAGSRSGSNVM